MQLNVVSYVLWFLTPCLQAGILLCMYRRGLHRDFLFFFTYTILSVVSEPVLALLKLHSYAAYFYGYYVHLALLLLLSFGVLQEIFENAFRPYEALRDLGVILFRWSALVVLLVAVMWAVNTAQKPDSNLLLDLFLLADRSLRLAQCGLVFFLLLLGEYLGIPHRSFLFGISLGMGFFAAVNMLVVTGVTHHGIVRVFTLRQINSAAYLVSVAIWLGYAVHAARAKSSVVERNPLRPRDWNSALQYARTPIPESSLLDTMDRTVERLLYPPTESEVKVSAGRG